MSSVRVEAIGTDSQAIPFQEASLDIWDKKYRLKSKIGEIIDDTIDDTYQRVAKAISRVEKTPELREEWYEKFLWALRRGAIPAGRVTSNAGAEAHKPATSTINCTVSGTIQDSMNGLAVSHRSSSGYSSRPRPSMYSSVFCSSTSCGCISIWKALAVSNSSTRN